MVATHRFVFIHYKTQFLCVELQGFGLIEYRDAEERGFHEEVDLSTKANKSGERVEGLRSLGFRVEKVRGVRKVRK